MSEAAQKKFRKLVRELGRLIREEAEKGLNAPETEAKSGVQVDAPRWASAFVDVRWFAGTNNSKSKLRIVQPNGELHCLLDTTRDMDDLLRKLWSVRKDDVSEGWYGLKVTVSHDGVITTELDNDPNCVVDPMWFDS